MITTVIDYGMGNLASVVNMGRKVGGSFTVSGDPAVIAKADKLILPGVGHFKFAMARLDELGLVDLLNEQVQIKGTPILGICLGAQLLGTHSEEGDCAGLGWLPMKTVAFDRSRVPAHLKIPHMGWTDTKRRRSMLFEGLSDDAKFYYVHSYHFVCDSPETIACTANHGYEFASGVQHKNIFGVQFHPEKSHKFGMQVLRNFLRFQPS